VVSRFLLKEYNNFSSWTLSVANNQIPPKQSKGRDIIASGMA
jgi:hypothetical protein